MGALRAGFYMDQLRVPIAGKGKTMTTLAAPHEMHANNQLLWIFAAANLVVALVITVWVLRRQRAQGGDLRLAISVLAGGLISPLVCPLWDYLTHTLHAQPSQTVVVSFFDGRAVTAWNYLAYYWFIGALGLFAYQMIKGGASVKQLWRLWAIIAAADILLEVPLQLINRDIYTYFGGHPFYSYDYFPLPMFCWVTNAACPLATAAVIILFTSTQVRGYLYVLPLVVASAWFGIFYEIPGWMYWTALGSDANTPTMYAVAVIGFAVFLYLYHVVATASVRAVSTGPSGFHSVATTAPDSVASGATAGGDKA